MDWKTILGIVEAAFVVVVFLVAAYYRKSEKLRGFIAELIKDAESEFAQQEKAGEQKMGWVIDQLYAYVPVIFKPFLTREKLQELAQAVFDHIAAYADIQVSNLRAKYEAKKKK